MKRETVVLGFRLPCDLVEAVDEAAAQMEKANVGLKISRNAVVQVLLHEAISARKGKR